jgi:phage terminase large subunit
VIKNTIKYNSKQSLALKYMNDDETDFVFYGGAVGGGKTFFACLNATSVCNKYPGAVCLLSRNKFTDFQQTTFVTLINTLKSLGLKDGIHYNTNMTLKVLRFKNGSKIVFPPLAFEPSDPEFTSIGSLELTHAYIDEAVETSRKLFDVIQTRIGRCAATKDIVKPKLFLASNPFKCWINDVFVQPYLNGTLPKRYKYIFANYKDNEANLGKDYVKNLLNIEDALTRSRLVEGNWNYDDSELKLFHYQSLMGAFGNVNLQFIDDGNRYMTVDVARFGKDFSVIGLWQGDYLYHIEKYDTNSIDMLYKRIKTLQVEHNIETRHIVADEDGVGGGLVDFLKCCGFSNNKASENYQNLKTQCIYKTAELINAGGLFIKQNIYREQIISEFDKYSKVETNDGKLKCTDKKTLKILLGRSPDFSDMIIMRRYFDETNVNGRVAFNHNDVNADAGEFTFDYTWNN